MNLNFSNKILAALSKIKGTGSFWSSSVNDFVFPGLTIGDVGEIAFPIAESQVKEMIKAARQAPYGKGSETVLDTSVRNTWEIDASQITFGNPQWQKLIDKILKDIKPDLGIENGDISAHLYKMLIYEEGGFFRMHRDSEKEPGMFGTLVVGLPSKHTGGEFLIRFEDKKSEISFAQAAADYKIPYIAFYADCEHEVKPVTAGYRVCLTYNLVQKPTKNPPKALPLKGAADELSGILKNAENELNTPKAILLGHQYTSENFGLNCLKLNDRPKAEALIKAAENAGCYAKLGLVTSYQSGELLTEDYDYGYRRNGWYDDDDDDDELAENGEMGEIYEEYITIDHWADDDALPALAGLNIEDDDIVKNFTLNEGEPAEKQAEGYTGNAGMEMQYWYHYGAVFVWSKKGHNAMLQSLPLKTRLSWLRYYVNNWSGISEAEKLFAKSVVKNARQSESRYFDEKEIDFDALADYVLLHAGSSASDERITEALAHYFEYIGVKKWTELLPHIGVENSKTLLSLAAAEKSAKKTAHLLRVLEKFSTLQNVAERTFLLEQIKKMPDYIVGLSLSNANLKPDNEHRFYGFSSETERKDDEQHAEVIVSVSVLLSPLAAGDAAWLEQMAQALTQNPTRTFVHKTLAEQLVEPRLAKLPLAKPLLEFCRDYLQTLVDNKPQPPADWSRPIPAAKYAPDKAIWNILADFMQSPVQQEFLYQKVQADRTRMEETIRRATVDLTMETIRKGSPHTLKLTKTQAAYERELKKWEEDERMLRMVEKRV